ncbi:MAG: hypothetical protein AABW52_02360 [Nanoarchaeota archaeon]
MENEPYKQKYLDVRRKNTLRKALRLQNIFKELFLHKTEKEMLHMLCQCGHYHYQQKGTPLSEDAGIMYEYLLTHNYNPYTVYKWFLIFLTDKAIQEEIENNNLSQSKAKRVMVTRRKHEEISRSWKFMEESRKTVMELLAYE